MIGRLIARLIKIEGVVVEALEPAPLRFCRDCKHCRPDQYLPMTPAYAGCYAPQNMEINLVDGSQKRLWMYCSTLRTSGTEELCGAVGRWFEPIEKADS